MWPEIRHFSLNAKQNFLISQICKPKWTVSGEISILKAKSSLPFFHRALQLSVDNMSNFFFNSVPSHATLPYCCLYWNHTVCKTHADIQAECMKPWVIYNAAWGLLQLLHFNNSFQVFPFNTIDFLAADVFLLSQHLLAVVTRDT